MAQAQYRPENALRRAKDFESSGDKDKALDHLYEYLAARKLGRQWQPAHEQMMMKFIELAVEYREGRKCKEGLHAYRNLAQHQQPSSLEKVVLTLIDLAMRKADEARARTENSVAQLSSVEDLEEESNPETMLMGAVTSEGSKDRAEREILLPWVRFMWDTYRNVLDVLRNTPLENLYHVVARRAMLFCNKYARTAEYRKLTALLRTHLLGIRRNLDQQGKGLSMESVEKHVNTRFSQLEHCAEMSLWNEGFRTIEDIHEIMEGAGFTPKPQLMATYYEKLSRIFWVSENYLFHAYAWYRFWLLTMQNKTLSDDDRRLLADATVLAAMSIPIYSSGGTGGGGGPGGAAASSGTALDVDVDERNKKTALASLLRVPTATGMGPVASGVPSRSALIADILSKGILKMAHPQVAALYKSLEVDFDPLNVVEKASVGLTWVTSNTANTLKPNIGIVGSSTAAGAHSLSQYVPNLERLTVFRLLEQLSAVYSTVTTAHLTALIAPLKLSFQDVEKLAVKSVKERLLAVRIDHRQAVVRLGSRDGSDMTATRRQLADLASRLQGVLDGSVLGGSDAALVAPETIVASPLRKDEVLTAAKATVDVARRWILERKTTLQKRREHIERERMHAQRAAEEKAAREAEHYRAMEAKRLAEEEAARIEAKRREIEEAQKKDEMLKMIAAAGRSIKDLEAAAAAHMDMATLQAQALERARKEQETENRRRTEQARRVDYLVRALREAERPKIEAHLKTVQTEQEGHVRTYNEGTLARARKQWDDALAMKSSMSKIMPHVEAYEAKIMKARAEMHNATKKAKQDAEKLIFFRAKKERALKRKEEEERRQAALAQQRREEEKRQAEAEEEERMRQREAKRQQQDEEARRMRDEASGPGDVRRLGGVSSSAAAGGVGASAGPAASEDKWKPRTGTGTAYVPPSARGATPGDNSWRGSGAAPAASASLPAASSAPAPVAPSSAGAGATGGYVPPHLRKQGAAAPAPAPVAPPAVPPATGGRWGNR